MEPTEFVVALERQVDVHALQIGPTMPLAIEDGIESLVNFAALVGPQHGFREGVHEGMGSGGEQARAVGGQQFLGLGHAGGKGGGQAF